MSGVVLLKKARKTEAVRVLLTEATKNWLKEKTSSSKLNICALAYSRDGETLLKRFGFRKYRQADETLDHFPMYAYLNASTIEFRRLVQHLTPELKEP